jgi:hypothetical protein
VAHGVGPIGKISYRVSEYSGDRVLRSQKFWAAAVIAIGLTVPAMAHHSHAMYEPDTRITLQGTVKEFQWVNPHSWLYLFVTNEAGETEEWALEARAPFRLAEQGWVPGLIQPGDEITVTVLPLRRGARGGLLGIVRMADGREFLDEF